MRSMSVNLKSHKSIRKCVYYAVASDCRTNLHAAEDGAGVKNPTQRSCIKSCIKQDVGLLHIQTYYLSSIGALTFLQLYILKEPELQ